MIKTSINIYVIPWWKRWLLTLLPTYRQTNNETIMEFKFWRGTFYIIKIKERKVLTATDILKQREDEKDVLV